MQWFGGFCWMFAATSNRPRRLCVPGIEVVRAQQVLSRTRSMAACRWIGEQSLSNWLHSAVFAPMLLS
jgi:hypothetical protein